MQSHTTPLRVCKDLRGLVALRAIRIFQHYAATLEHDGILPEFAKDMVTDFIQTEDRDSPDSLIKLVERLEEDETRYAAHPNSEMDYLLLDYWEIVCESLLRNHLRDWVLFNGLRPLSGKDFNAFFTPLLEEPEKIGIAFVDTYRAQTHVNVDEVNQLKQAKRHARKTRNLEKWRLGRSIPSVITRDQWLSLGIDALMPYHELDALLVRWAIELEEAYDHPRIHASHIGKFMRCLVSIFQIGKIDVSSPIGVDVSYFPVGALGGPKAIHRRIQEVFTDDYLAASIRAYPARQKLVRHLLARVETDRDVAVQHWRALRNSPLPSAKECRSSLATLARTYQQQLFR